MNRDLSTGVVIGTARDTGLTMQPLVSRNFQTAGLQAVIGAVIFLVGCTGAIESAFRDGDGPGRLNPNPNAGGAGPSNDPRATDKTLWSADPATCVVDTNPGWVGLRRLTRLEYDNTVRDLLGDTTSPAVNNFPVDDTAFSDTLGVAPLMFEKHYEVARTLVEAAWARQAAGTQPAGVSLWPCQPVANDAECARTIVSTFARKAWRRPVAPDELAPYLGLLDQAQSLGDDYVVGTKEAISALLTSPNFLFRPELDPDPGSNEAHDLGPHELATRLSYFLWASMPDDRLFQLADAGDITDRAILNDEIARMLADPRAVRFVDMFSAWWIGASGIDQSRPDPDVFPMWNENLRASMRNETTQFLIAFIREDLPMEDLLLAGFTYVDRGLARHYGWDETMAGGARDTLRRVAVPDGYRRGLLGKASLLTMTSKPNASGAVKRGRWVLGNLLCSAPPPPPPDLDVGEEAPPGDGEGAPRTQREFLAHHSSEPRCQGCHAALDPIGLGLEVFDAVGRYRTHYDNGEEIDAAGQLPGDVRFDGPEELGHILAKDARFSQCLTTQIFTFALARELGRADECLMAKALSDVDGTNGSLGALITRVALSHAFTRRRGASIPGEAP